MFGQKEKINRLEDELKFLRDKVNKQEIKIWELENPVMYKKGDKVLFTPKNQVLCIELTVIESIVRPEYIIKNDISPYVRFYNCITNDYNLIEGIDESKIRKSTCGTN